MGLMIKKDTAQWNDHQEATKILENEWFYNQQKSICTSHFSPYGHLHYKLYFDHILSTYEQFWSKI